MTHRAALRSEDSGSREWRVARRLRRGGHPVQIGPSTTARSRLAHFSQSTREMEHQLSLGCRAKKNAARDGAGIPLGKRMAFTASDSSPASALVCSVDAAKV